MLYWGLVCWWLWINRGLRRMLSDTPSLRLLVIRIGACISYLFCFVVNSMGNAVYMSIWSIDWAIFELPKKASYFLSVQSPGCHIYKHIGHIRKWILPWITCSTSSDITAFKIDMCCFHSRNPDYRNAPYGNQSILRTVSRFDGFQGYFYVMS